MPLSSSNELLLDRREQAVLQKRFKAVQMTRTAPAKE